MQVKIGIRFNRAEINYFDINTLYAYVKQIICKGIHFLRGGGDSHKNINIPLPFSSFVTPPLPSVKTTKNLRSTEGFVFFTPRC